MGTMAVIGTRNATSGQSRLAHQATVLALELGHNIATGGAYGIDSVAMETVRNRGLTQRLHVYLPSPSYHGALIPRDSNIHIYNRRNHSEWHASVAKYHPNPAALGGIAYNLHARNYGIVATATLVFAAPSPTGGGTAQGIRIAHALGIPCIICTGNETWPDIEAQIRRHLFPYLKVYTSNIAYKGNDRLDVTVKSGDLAFAPTWEMVMGVKNGTITPDEYQQRYMDILTDSVERNLDHWISIFAKGEVTLCCYCPSGSNECHRYQLAAVFEEFGAEYIGER